MYNKRRFVLCVLQISFVATLASAQVYKITDLGPLSPTAINIWGQVVGNLNGQAFIWTQFAGQKGLGTLTGGTSSYATSINDFGVVTGSADGPGTVISPDPSLYPNEQCGDLIQPFVWTPRNGMGGALSRSAAPGWQCSRASFIISINCRRWTTSSPLRRALSRYQSPRSWSNDDDINRS